jgi:hypothetical protein
VTLRSHTTSDCSKPLASTTIPRNYCSLYKTKHLALIDAAIGPTAFSASTFPCEIMSEVCNRTIMSCTEQLTPKHYVVWQHSSSLVPSTGCCTGVVTKSSPERHKVGEICYKGSQTLSEGHDVEEVILHQPTVVRPLRRPVPLLVFHHPFLLRSRPLHNPVSPPAVRHPPSRYRIARHHIPLFRGTEACLKLLVISTLFVLQYVIF